MSAEQQLSAALAEIAKLRAQLAEQSSPQTTEEAPPAAAAAAPTSSGAPRPRIPPASHYAGSAVALDNWVREMTQQFAWYRIVAPEERVAMACAQLRGPALDWWSTLPAATSAELSQSERRFVQALRERFQPVDSAQTARLALDSLRQGPKQSVHDYTSDFRRLLAAVPDMSEADRVHRFVQGLRAPVQAQLLVHGVKTLDEAIAMAARVGSLSLFAASSAAAAAHSSAPRGDAMDLSVLGFGLDAPEVAVPEASMRAAESEAADGSAGSAVGRAMSEMRQMHQQLLHVMQQQQQPSSRRAKQPRAGGDRRLPVVDHLAPRQVREYMEAGKCFGCGQTGHSSRHCPQSRQSN